MKKHTLKPYIRKDRVNLKGECPVNIRYTFHRKILNIPIGIVIKPENWSEVEEYPIQNKSYNFKETIRKIDIKLTELENIKLRNEGFSTKNNSMKTIGYKEFDEYLSHKQTLEKTKELIKMHTRQYAKRQMTWFKRNKDIKWVKSNKEAIILVSKFL